MSLALLLPPADAWSTVPSRTVVPRAHFEGMGEALVARGPGAVDDPRLMLAYGNIAPTGKKLTNTLLYGRAAGDAPTIGFGAAHHSLVAREPQRWREAGGLVRHGASVVTREQDHRYTIHFDGTEVGEVGREGSVLFFAPPVGPGFVARERPGGLTMEDIYRLRREEAQRSRVDRGEPARGVRSWPSALREGWKRNNADQTWLPEVRILRGTWDVFDAAGDALLTVCPPGGAHEGRRAVVPQPGPPVPAEAVFLAAYLGFAGALFP